MRLLVTGGRGVEPNPGELMCLSALLLERGGTEIVHGDCRGVDQTVARAFSSSLFADVLRVPAELFGDWPSCGPKRNAAMVSYVKRKGGFVVAWPGGAGTADCVAKAAKAGLEVLTIEEVCRCAAG